ncbi:hypothetical protein KIH74_13780 [Kineosporia sp. J2-2]|uniref:Uncharacterized protein n=1 Tax=Kineosporia corallincola TaxID=2835133 RepID=A0ABS5TGL7_9ACTN|nr:hypothetical protein [Kineosporia corallincola]MBT0770003.1 hypothetical protein [Kineosporia corallincola]
MSNELRAPLRWILGVEGAPEPRPADREPEALAEISAAAFAVAVELRFGEQATAEQAREFVTHLGDIYLKPGALDPRLAEQMILSVYDEVEGLDDVSLEQTVAAQNLITAATVQDMGITEEALERFIDDVVELIVSLDDEDDED